MISVDLSTRECDGQVIVALRGVLDVPDAASVAAALTAAAARQRDIIIAWQAWSSSVPAGWPR